MIKKIVRALVTHEYHDVAGELHKLKKGKAYELLFKDDRNFESILSMGKMSELAAMPKTRKRKKSKVPEVIHEVSVVTQDVSDAYEEEDAQDSEYGEDYSGKDWDAAV